MLNDKKVCIFIDGENLRHSIGELFPAFNRKEYLPKTDWAKFFDWIACEASGPKAERIRAYWYVVGGIDYSPFNLNAARKEHSLEKLLTKNKKFAAVLNDAPEKDRQKIMEKMADGLQEDQSSMEKRFTGWTYLQDEIARTNKSIEFRRAGSIRYDLFERKFGSEKAVDVKLATDLIKLKDIYDVAVIVSGDQDYVPAVDAIKDFGKHTVNVSFLTEAGSMLPGGAKRLNQRTDWSLEIKYSDSKNYLGF